MRLTTVTASSMARRMSALTLRRGPSFDCMYYLLRRRNSLCRRVKIVAIVLWYCRSSSFWALSSPISTEVTFERPADSRHWKDSAGRKLADLFFKVVMCLLVVVSGSNQAHEASLSGIRAACVRFSAHHLMKRLPVVILLAHNMCL